MTAWRVYLAAAALGALGCSSCSPGTKSGPAPTGTPSSEYWTPPSASLPSSFAAPPETIKGAPGHPRLFVRESDLPRLRSWAVRENPIFASGLNVLARDCARRMDAGEVAKDNGGYTYSGAPAEGFAEIFAFMSLVSTSEPERQDYARRAKKLLMTVIDKAAEGVAEGQPYRDRRFSVVDRARWSGEGFGLTVDWIYGSLTADDKAKIRKVFLRWADEITHATTTDENHPEPIGVVNDPKLVSDRKKVRWATNNYWTGHLRNLGLMALSFDAADDPGDKLRGYLTSVTGAWLYVTDALMRTDMAGGLAAEGFEYSPQAIGYVAQFLTALATAGMADPKKYGPQVTYANPFWADLIPAYLHSLSPVPSTSTEKEYSYLGPMYAVAWYGDGDKTWATDPMGVLGPIAVYDQLARDDKQLAQIRWIETHVPPSGESQLTKRASDSNGFLDPILYFLVFDPKAGAPADPRPALPLTHLARGLGRILARTSWTPDASWFSYMIGWATIDHQHADGNMFELWRKGEWLTKERTGYGFHVASSDYHNTLTIENDPPFHKEGYRAITQARGSQWIHVPEGDGKLVASSLDPKYVYALGDSTALYQSSYEHSTDVVHASRSIVWLTPDRVFVYDRAETKTDKRFKRFWLNLTSPAKLDGTLLTMTTPKGQKLFVRSLLPTGAGLEVAPVEPLNEGGHEPAKLDSVRFRLRVEAPGGPKRTRFLHTLQGADGAAAPDTATLLKSTQGTPFEGVAQSDVAVMFPVDVGPFGSLTYSAPASTKAHLVTGLAPGASYRVATKPAGSGIEVTVTPGGDQKADAGGVLLIGKLP